MLTATVQGEEDSKDDGQHTRNAPLKSGPKLKDGGETRLDLFWSLPLGFGNPVSPTQEEGSETDGSDKSSREFSEHGNKR